MLNKISSYLSENTEAIKKGNRIMLHGEILVVYSGNHTKHINRPALLGKLPRF
jgi:hypothetical protein